MLLFVKVMHASERWSVFTDDNVHLGWVDHIGFRQWSAITPHNERLAPMPTSKRVAAQMLQMHHALLPA
jgi:hypothetical protein